MSVPRLLSIAGVWALTTCGLVPWAAADVIELKTGGQIRGAFAERIGRNAGPVKITTVSGVEIVVDDTQIEASHPRLLRVEKYLTLLKNTGNTVNEQWELAQWCLKNRLPTRREQHLNRVIELDPDHAEARTALGYTLSDGQWLTTAQIKQAQGLVEFKGRYITPQELEIIEAKTEQKELISLWNEKVHRWHNSLSSDNAYLVQDAAAELRAITNPMAVGALEHYFSDDPVIAHRKLYIEILAGIDGPAPVRPMVVQSIFDANSAMRSFAFEAIPEPLLGTAIGFYAEALTNEDNIVVRRAGALLGGLGDERAVPALVEALLTSHRYKIQVVEPAQYSFRADGYGMANQNLPIPPDIEFGLRTGQFPQGIVVNQWPPPPTKTVSIRYTHQNAEVLRALVKITGQNFGYDQTQWRRWWADHTNQT